MAQAAPQQMMQMGQQMMGMVMQQEPYIPNAHDMEGCWLPSTPLGMCCGLGMCYYYCPYVAVKENLMIHTGLLFFEPFFSCWCQDDKTGDVRCINNMCVGMQMMKAANQDTTGLKYDGNVQEGDEAKLIGCCICEPCCYSICPCTCDIKRMKVFRPNPTYKPNPIAQAAQAAAAAVA